MSLLEGSSHQETRRIYGLALSASADSRFGESPGRMGHLIRGSQTSQRQPSDGLGFREHPNFTTATLREGRNWSLRAGRLEVASLAAWSL